MAVSNFTNSSEWLYTHVKGKAYRQHQNIHMYYLFYSETYVALQLLNYNIARLKPRDWYRHMG